MNFGLLDRQFRVDNGRMGNQKGAIRSDFPAYVW